ncbi:response regulator transcription factor [Oscillospiraceae bacterium OttesenSCG-928-G22]|nr:response regulator transcription factor [Oscillospiraceae bacterium OttesenSCG-928-G22]
MSATILLVEDNRHILEINRGTLSDVGYRVLETETLAAAREILEQHHPDLLVLDVMLPDGDGVEFCTDLRAQGMTVPVLFLTAKGEKNDILEGLRAGGDDYLVKPYDLDIFLARIQTLLRRNAPAPTAVVLLKVGDMEMDFVARRVTRAGVDLLLTPKEFALLEQLFKYRDSYVPTATLYEDLWGMDSMGAVGTVKTRIFQLRRKLGEDAPVQIEAVRGKGYRLIALP